MAGQCSLMRPLQLGAAATPGIESLVVSKEFLLHVLHGFADPSPYQSLPYDQLLLQGFIGIHLFLPSPKSTPCGWPVCWLSAHIEYILSTFDVLSTFLKQKHAEARWDTFAPVPYLGVNSKA